jgi:ABC-2 type transport system permease protein
MIPVASVSSAFINMLLNLIVVFVFIIFSSNNALSPSTLIVFPLVIIELVVLSVATGFFLASLYVKYRDIEHIWDIARQALFYTIPIIYPLSMIHVVEIQKIIILNPLAQIIQQARAVTTYSGNLTIADLYQNQFIILVPLAFVFLALVISVWYFRKRSKFFAEDI